MVQVQPKLTPTEYLTLEREAETRSEYLDGEVFAMAGASPGLWLLREIDGEGEKIVLRGLEIRLPMDQIFRKLDLVRSR